MNSVGELLCDVFRKDALDWPTGSVYQPPVFPADSCHIMGRAWELFKSKTEVGGTDPNFVCCQKGTLSDLPLHLSDSKK